MELQIALSLLLSLSFTLYTSPMYPRLACVYSYVIYMVCECASASELEIHTRKACVCM